ncbi:MAG: hypothetical protein PVF26_13605, partial [Desulfobacterales bacterium]
IDTVSQSMSKQWIWLWVLFVFAIAVRYRHKAQGARHKENRLRNVWIEEKRESSSDIRYTAYGA